MRHFRIYILPLLLAGCLGNSVFGGDSNLDNAVLAGDWQSILEIVTDPSVEHDEIHDFLKDISCLALDLDCSPGFFMTAPQERAFHESVRNWIESLRKKHIDNGYLSYLLGNLYSGSGEHRKALSQLNLAINENQNAAQFYMARSLVYLSLRDLSSAMKDVDQALLLDSSVAESYMQKGTILTIQHNDEEALHSYDRAIKKQPDRGQYFYNRANSFISLGRYVDAIADYSHAIELGFTDAPVFFNRANANFEKIQLDDAKRDYKRFLGVYSDQFAQQASEAITRIKVINLIESQQPEELSGTFLGLGISGFQQGLNRLAVNYLTRALELDSTKRNAYYWRASAFTQLEGKEQQALDDYTQAVYYVPSDTSAFYNRGIIHARLNRLNEAISDFSSAIELNPSYEKALENRADAYEILGKNESAIADYKILLGLVPDSDPKQREHLSNLIHYLVNPSSETDLSEIEAAVREAYVHWENQDWERFSKSISYDQVSSFHSDMMPFSIGLFGQEDTIVVNGSIISRNSFVGDDPLESFASYMRLFSNERSSLRSMMKIDFVEINKIIPMGEDRALARINIRVDDRNGSKIIQIDNDAVLTSSGWRIILPLPLANLTQMINQGTISTEALSRLIASDIEY